MSPSTQAENTSQTSPAGEIPGVSATTYDPLEAIKIYQNTANLIPQLTVTV